MFHEVQEKSAGRLCCPICERHSDAWKAGGDPKKNKMFCRHCKSKPRQRMEWLYLKLTGRLQQVKKVLHVAPETGFSNALRLSVGDGYVGCDIDPTRPGVTHSFSLESIPFSDHHFDLIICNHVLEHVHNDRLAMSEMARVLHKDGVALLTFPVNQNSMDTVEDPSITDPLERERLFGQHDHVRKYGLDVIGRLEKTGFKVLPLTGYEISGEGLEHYGLRRREPMFVCSHAPIDRADGEKPHLTAVTVPKVRSVTPAAG